MHDYLIIVSMKRICVFNEKGGTGKTTVGLFLAGYLAYGCGKRVCVIDYDYPSYHFSSMREQELRLLEIPQSPLSVWFRDNAEQSAAYDVMRFPSSGGTPVDVISFAGRAASGGYDYLIYDFPGAFTLQSPVSILAMNDFIDFVAVPMDTDSQSRRSALVVADAFLNAGISCCAFWNRVTLYESKGDRSRFRRGAEPFTERGIPVMDEAVREIRKFSRDSDEHLFVRSTLCFPQKYIRQWCPSLPLFLSELKSRIDR